MTEDLGLELLDVRLHLHVGHAAEVGLEALEVVDGAAAVGSVNDLLTVHVERGGHGAPSRLDGGDGVD